MPVDKIEKEKSQEGRKGPWQGLVTPLSVFQIDPSPDDHREPGIELSFSKSFNTDGSKDWDKKDGWRYFDEQDDEDDRFKICGICNTSGHTFKV